MEGLPIFFTQGPIPDHIMNLLSKKGITYMSPTDFYESANDGSFNESKFMGSIALTVAQGKPIILSDIKNYITKKGNGLTLSYHIDKRAKISHTFILITESNELDNLTIKKISLDEFEKYNTEQIKTDMSKIKVTCGLLGTTGKTTGHITRAFGISYDESNLLQENNAVHLNKVYSGTNIKLNVSGKEGGAVIMIADLGETAHITNNTSIRSVLSGPVLEKYNNKIMEFKLKDIDENAKQDLTIKLEKDDDVYVLITGWYCYAI